MILGVRATAGRLVPLPSDRARKRSMLAAPAGNVTIRARTLVLKTPGVSRRQFRPGATARAEGCLHGPRRRGLAAVSP
jgi:hypothetical protein